MSLVDEMLRVMVRDGVAGYRRWRATLSWREEAALTGALDQAAAEAQEWVESPDGQAFIEGEEKFYQELGIRPERA